MQQSSISIIKLTTGYQIRQFLPKPNVVQNHILITEENSFFLPFYISDFTAVSLTIFRLLCLTGGIVQRDILYYKYNYKFPTCNRIANTPEPFVLV